VSGRWRQDNSGRIHPLDSVEAKEVALTEVYLAARGYLFPERMPATINALDASREGTTTFVRVVATPLHGRPVTLWINASTHLIDRAVLDLSVGQKVIQYENYRRVGSLTLPFTIRTEHRDENETGIANIRDYELATGSEQPELRRPTPVGSDVHMSTGTPEARVKSYLDRNSGFFIVPVAINGRGPYPFILDTGGHDILTPDAVRDLGLKTYGKGFSTGAGPGSMPTEFTKVESVAIGAATITRQPFTVLHIDLGLTQAPGGERRPIAGILGLELFERFIVRIDYRAGTVILRPPRLLHYEPASAIPLTFTSDMPVVQASINGNSGWFDLDTGNNTDLVVFRQWAVTHEMMSLLSKAPLMQGSSVGGAIHMQKWRAQGFEIGNQKLSDIDFLLSSDEEGSLSAKWEAGNIGNEILRHFKAVTFDYSSERMYLE
jgi:Aspartyl protease